MNLFHKLERYLKDGLSLNIWVLNLISKTSKLLNTVNLYICTHKKVR